MAMDMRQRRQTSSAALLSKVLKFYFGLNWFLGHHVQLSVCLERSHWEVLPYLYIFSLSYWSPMLFSFIPHKKRDLGNSVRLWFREHLSARCSVQRSKIYSLKEGLSGLEHRGRWYEEQYNAPHQESSAQSCTSWISSSKKILIQFALTCFQTGSNEENARHSGAAPEMVKHQDMCSRIGASGPAFHPHTKNTQLGSILAFWSFSKESWTSHDDYF